MLRNLPATQETTVRSLAWEDPLEKGMTAHSSILAGTSHGQRSLVVYSPWGHKESDTTQQSALSVGTKRCFAREGSFARLPQPDPLGSISVANA